MGKAQEVKRSKADKALMRRFLEAAKGYSEEEVEADSGINRESVRLYRVDEWTRLTAKTRRRMKEYIGARPARESPTYVEGMRAAVEKVDATLSELRRIIEAATSEGGGVPGGPGTVVDEVHPPENGEGSQTPETGTE